MKTIIARPILNRVQRGLLGMLLLLGLILTGAAQTALGETAKNQVNFDHLKTGFPLDGVHSRLKCEDCHVQGVFKGTPTKCSICHSPGSRTATTSKSASHMPTALPCENCHKSAVSWNTARFSHAEVKPGTCKSCHGVSAAGKPSNHIATNESCDTCHRTTAWLPAVFNHTGVRPGACATCHGVTARGKTPDHIPTSASCDVCHRTTSWQPASYHASVQATPGSCITCHGGSFPKHTPVKPSTHPVTGASCETCHVGFVSWVIPAGTFNHAGVLPGTCNTCHGISARGKSRDHIPTSTSCDVCHKIAGKFLDGRYHANVQATPGSCTTCHGGSYPKHTPVKPSTHPVTSASCETCHTGFTTWVLAAGSFNHAGVVPGTCNTCHGISARGKSTDHIPTTVSCDTCHSISGAFLDGHYHRNVQATPGSCILCHGGSYPKHTPVKPGTHPVTGAACDTCHTGFTTWAITAFNHAGVLPGTCSTCHGISAKGKPGNHIPTTASCDLCHKITGMFLDGRYHANVQATPGNCASCHGVNPNVRGKPNGHFITSRSCDVCHSTTAWVPTLRYTHTSPNYRQHNAGVTCANCHGTPGNEVIAWKFSAYKPNCAGCHADDFKADSHKKTTSPTTIRYTVAELKDCSGSCHEYTNNTFTTIKTNRNSKHRSTDGGF